MISLYVSLDTTSLYVSLDTASCLVQVFGLLELSCGCNDVLVLG